MPKSNLNILNRRAFLSQSFKTGMAIAMSTLVDIPFVMKRALAEGNIGLSGKKVLFIWLRGANDSLNSIIPIGDSQYAANRPNIALPQDLGINYANLGPCFVATQYADASFAPRAATDCACAGAPTPSAARFRSPMSNLRPAAGSMPRR